MKKILKYFIPTTITTTAILRQNRFSKEPHIRIKTQNLSDLQKQNKVAVGGKQRVIVIGGGIVGCTTAYYLNKFNDPNTIEIVLLDKAQKVCSQSSRMNGRHAAANVGIFYDVSIFQYLLESLKPQQKTGMKLNPLIFFEFGSLKHFARFFRNRYFGNTSKQTLRGQKLLEERSNANFTEEVVEVANKLNISKQDDLKFFQHSQNKIWIHGKKIESSQNFKEFSDEEIKQFCQKEHLNYSPESFPSFYSFPGSKMIQTRQWGEALLQYSGMNNNLQIQNETKVLSWIVDSKDRKKVIGVVTDKGNFYGDKFIISNGMEAKFIAKPLGITLPIVAGKGYGINLTPKSKQLLPSTQCTFVDYNEIYYVNVSNKDIRLTGTFEFSTYDDWSVNQEQVGYNQLKNKFDRKIKRLTNIFNKLFKLKSSDCQIQEWAGIRPCTPDSLPIVGQMPQYGNVFLNCGHGGRGTNHSLQTGQLIAAIISSVNKKEGEQKNQCPNYEELKMLLSPDRFKKFF